MKNTIKGLMGKRQKKHSRRSKGQAIVIVAFAAIALVAVFGLAIDGGRLLLLHRDAQNASDAAVLAATLSLCSGGSVDQIRAAGEAAAAANGFTNNTNNTIVIVELPPEGAPPNTCITCAVGVKIQRDIDPYFIQLVYSGTLEATTHAIGSCAPDSVPNMADTNDDDVPDANVPPIAAFWGGAPPGACNQPAVDLAGSDITIKGNLHSNSDLKVNPGNQAGAVDCDNVPSPLDGGWTFGELTYSGSDSGFQDAKTNSCDWDDAPGVDADPPVCGAECQTSSDDPTDPDKDPEQVDPYLKSDGSIFWPVDYDIADFRPNGSVDTELGSTQYLAYTDAPANCNGSSAVMDYDWVADNHPDFIEANGDLKPAVYYSPCSINMGHNMGGDIEITLVAEEEIAVNGTMNATAFYDDLLFFANGPAPPSGPSCVANGVHISSSSSQFNGNIFAPNGNAQFSASAAGTPVNGCVIGYVTQSSASGLDVTCEPGDTDTRPTVSVTQ